MEEQASWKGHSFTLLVFGGIVFLCSIFFVLGMLVGRGQGQRAAESAAVNAAAKATAAESKNASPEGTSAIAVYEGIETGKQASRVETPASEPVKDDTVKDDPPLPPPPAPPAANAPASPVLARMIFLQVGAMEKEAAADKIGDELRKKGFPVIIASGGPDKLFKIQVGPFSNAADIEIANNKLEALGFSPIRK